MHKLHHKEGLHPIVNLRHNLFYGYTNIPDVEQNVFVENLLTIQTLIKSQNEI